MTSRWSRWRRVGVHVDEAEPAGGAGPARRPSTSPRTTRCSVYLQQHPGTVAVKDLDLESPALERDAREAAIDVVVPLVSQGELIGVLNLGPRRSERPVQPR